MSRNKSYYRQCVQNTYIFLNAFFSVVFLTDTLSGYSPCKSAKTGDSGGHRAAVCCRLYVLRGQFRKCKAVSVFDEASVSQAYCHADYSLCHCRSVTCVSDHYQQHHCHALPAGDEWKRRRKLPSMILL